MSIFGGKKDPLDGLRGPQFKGQTSPSQEHDGNKSIFDVTFNYDNGNSVDLSLKKEDVWKIDEWLNNPAAPNFLQLWSEGSISYVRKDGLYNVEINGD